MKDYIEALREIKKEKKNYKITLSREEVLVLVNEFDRLNNIIQKARKIINNVFDDEEWYLNNDYNDLEYTLKYVKGVLDKENK